MSDEIVSILLVEDNPGDARLFEEALKEAHASRYKLVHCRTFAEAFEYLAKETPDIVVVDLGLPDAFGIEVVRKTRAAAPLVPIVVLTNRADEELGTEALHEGAQDYLVKGELDARFLARALRYSMERHRLQQALRNESLIDELTGLYNRRGFLTVAGNYVKLAERMRAPYALAFVDLDGMKAINDFLGHAEGDRALVDTADLLRSCLRQTDILARLGGDEFVLLLADANPNTDELVRQRLREQLASYNAQPDRRFTLSFSVGIAMATGERPPPLEELMARADASMYEEKQSKKEVRLTFTPS